MVEEDMEMGRDNMSKLGLKPTGAGPIDGMSEEENEKWLNEGMTAEEMERKRIEKLEGEVAVLEKKMKEFLDKFQQLEQYINKHVRTRNESNR